MDGRAGQAVRAVVASDLLPMDSVLLMADVPGLVRHHSVRLLMDSLRRLRRLMAVLRNSLREALRRLPARRRTPARRRI